ncbi:MAG: SBBP repeat-containing protein [Candidatus Acidiferrales bacterium]
MKHRTFALLVAMTLFAPGITFQTLAQNIQRRSASQTDPKAQAKILDQYGKLPLSFEANYGQTDSKVDFLSRGHGYSIFLTDKEAVIALKKTAGRSPEGKVLPGHKLFDKQNERATKGTVVRMKLAGANPTSLVLGAEELSGKANYFLGNDPAQWRTNIPRYAKVKYQSVYPGVDLVYYGSQGQLEYDFVLAPRVNPNEICLKFDGGGKVRVDEKGDLLLGSAGEEVRFEKPVAYQEVAGERKRVEGSYMLESANRIGFRLGEYDQNRPLIIDPVLSYSTYLGGSTGDDGFGIAVDAFGNAYVTGETASTDFPTAHALQPTYGGGSEDAFVAKINPSGSALVYSTYLGGNNYEYGYGIAVDAFGNAYVMGYTQSSNFPTTAGAFEGTCCGAFVTKINASGSALVYSTFLNGAEDDGIASIAVDASGNAYVTGGTSSANFPTTAGAFQTTLNGSTNAFVTKFNPRGSALVYSTYLGGSTYDYGYGIAVDTFGNAYVTGSAESSNFPTTTGAFQNTCCGAFVTKINSSGSALVYSTFLDGATGDAIAVDADGSAYVTGNTSSTTFPTVNAFQSKLLGFPNAFVTKFNRSGSALVYSTYLGGSTYEYGYGIAVDASGNAYVTGETASTDFPTANALEPAYGGGFEDGFVTKIDPSGSALIYSTYLGGSDEDVGQGIAVDRFRSAYVAGFTNSTNFPTANALQPAPVVAGAVQAFIAKISSAPSDDIPPTTTAIPSPEPNSHGWNNTNVTVELKATDNSGGSGVEQIQFSLSGAENIGLQIVPGSSASVTISAQGITKLTYFATDNAGNQGMPKTLTVQIDLTPPVVSVTGVSNGAVYYYEHAPAAGCNTTDALSGVATPASLAVTGGNEFGFGNYKATCSGAEDEAGNIAAAVSVSYTINGPTLISGVVGLQTGPMDARVWEIIIGNSGPGIAYSAEISSLTFPLASGLACRPRLVSRLPVSAGNISPFSATTAFVTIDFSGCLSNATLEAVGQVSANDATAVGPILMLAERP